MRQDLSNARDIFKQLHFLYSTVGNLCGEFKKIIHERSTSRRVTIFLHVFDIKLFALM